MKRRMLMLCMFVLMVCSLVAYGDIVGWQSDTHRAPAGSVVPNPIFVMSWNPGAPAMEWAMWPNTAGTGTNSPALTTEIATYPITVSAGTYDLYVHQKFNFSNNDGFFIGNGFGAKATGVDADWYLLDQQSANGYTDADGAPITNGTWQWLKITNTAITNVPPYVSTGGTETVSLGAKDAWYQPDAFVLADVGSTLSSVDLFAAFGVVIDTPDVATNPDPTNNEQVVPIDTDLKWDNPTSYAAAKFSLEVLRGEYGSDPNWLSPNVVVVDPVVDLALDGDPNTTEADMPALTPALGYDDRVYWRVTSYEPNDVPGGVPVVGHTGPNWSFRIQAADTEPAVTLPNYTTWLDNLTSTVIAGTVSDNGELDVVDADVAWSIVSTPAGGEGATLTKTSTDWENPTAELATTVAGDYTVRLTAIDTGGNPGTAGAIVRVSVDACEAAKTQAGFQVNYYDDDDDCDVDIVDFAAFALRWLDDRNLTEAITW